MTNETKKELAAFLRDYSAMCIGGDCNSCAMNGYDCSPKSRTFDIDLAIEAAEKWRETRKPKPEVIDKAVDIYTFEVEVERGKSAAQAWTPKQLAEYAADCLERIYRGNGATVSVLSAKRFALETHREEDE